MLNWWQVERTSEFEQVASTLRVTPRSSCISRLSNPLDSKKETCLSVGAFRTSSSRRKRRAFSMTDARDGVCCGAVSLPPFFASCEAPEGLSCHEGTPPFFLSSSESPIFG